jgi:hypothetical protein
MHPTFSQQQVDPRSIPHGSARQQPRPHTGLKRSKSLSLYAQKQACSKIYDLILAGARISMTFRYGKVPEDALQEIDQLFPEGTHTCTHK